MALPEEHAIKFTVYTLFCHSLVDHLESLRLACDSGSPTFTACLDKLDSGLKALFDTRNIDKSQAINLVARHLETAAEDTRLSNPEAAKAIQTARAAALARASTWDYRDAIERCHKQGRQLAILFFENSPWKSTRRRLKTRAVLDYQYGRAKTAQYLRMLDHMPPGSQKDRLIELFYENEIREKRQNYGGLAGSPYTFQGKHDGNYSISVPLTRENNLMLYAGYPFLFMHEYSAHIFSLDHFNDKFNDGWMLYAASQYLAKNWPSDHRLSRLKRAQAYAFKHYLRGTLSPQSLAHHDFAETFDYFLLSLDRTRFDSMTYELAAYEPSAGESKVWPTLVLTKLEAEMRNASRLRHRLNNASTLDALYPGLKSELPLAGIV